jgi:hypothetical protein
VTDANNAMQLDGITLYGQVGATRALLLESALACLNSVVYVCVCARACVRAFVRA